MENPSSWTRAEHIVHDVMQTHERQREVDVTNGDFPAGLSLTRQITDALRSEGLLAEHDGAAVMTDTTRPACTIPYTHGPHTMTWGAVEVVCLGVEV